jgi:hypothetical protein
MITAGIILIHITDGAILLTAGATHIMVGAIQVTTGTILITTRFIMDMDIAATIIRTTVAEEVLQTPMW